MQGSEEELKLLGSLIMAGQIDGVQRCMVHHWPPDSDWSQDDVGHVCMILTGLWRLQGQRALPIYRVFAARLKSAEGDRLWHSTIWTRTEVIADYESPLATRAWLNALIATVPPPTVGVIHLALGRLLMREGDLAAARAQLGHAVGYSLMGIEWFSLEALNEMATCLGKLGDIRLAFEYSRSHAMTSYRLGRIKGDELRQALIGQAALFGQIDYWVELERNFADEYRANQDYSAASELESQVAYRLAEIGAVHEASRLFLKASDDAYRGVYYPSDKPFAVTCRQLARLLHPTPLRVEDLDQAAESCKQLWFPTDFSEAYSRVSGVLRDGRQDNEAVDHLLKTIHRHAPKRVGREDHGEFLNLVQVCAFVGRFFRDHGDLDGAARVWRGIMAIQGRTDAIFVFVAEWLAEDVLAQGSPQEALEMAQLILGRRRVLVHERFIHHALTARASLALGRKQEAFAEAVAAISDWTRVLDGLYVEEHKLAWLQRGEAVLLCAINAIREKVPWMDELKRRRELFRLTEIGKARILTDMVASRGYQLGAFGLAKSNRLKGDLFEAAAFHGSDWLAPLMVQSIAFVDTMNLIVHDEKGGAQFTTQDVKPLKYAVQLPASPERRLVASSASIPFAQADIPNDDSFRRDLEIFLSPN